MLSHALKAPYFTVFSNIHKPSEKRCAQLKGPNAINEDNPELYEHGLPIVSFQLSSSRRSTHRCSRRGSSRCCAPRGGIVPNYNAPAGEDETQILRIVGTSYHTRVMRLF
jgi:glutamate decarboxylase